MHIIVYLLLELDFCLHFYTLQVIDVSSEYYVLYQTNQGCIRMKELMSVYLFSDNVFVKRG